MSVKQRLQEKHFLRELHKSTDRMAGNRFQTISKIVAEEVVRKTLEKDADNDWEYTHDGVDYDLTGYIRRGELMLLQQILKRLDGVRMTLEFSDGSTMKMEMTE